MTQNSSDIPSPCVRNCCLNREDICLGCGRSLNEITGWSRQNNDQKRKTLDQSKQRLREINR